MSRIRPGSTVTISYIGTLDNGYIFASTDTDGPLTCTLGAGELFPALEKALLGMREGEAKNIVLSAAEAYGPRRPENFLQLPRDAFPVGKELVVGQKLGIEFRGGDATIMRIVAVAEDGVTLDGNHPLAGCELTFALRVDRIE